MRHVARIFASLVVVLIVQIPAVAHADLFEDIVERKKIRVGVALFTPWAFVDKHGGLAGFEIDVATKLAHDMGVEAEFKQYDLADLIPALNRGDIDVIVAGLAITPKRALQMNFTLPYAESGVALATNTAKTADVQELRDLNHPQIVVTAVARTQGADVAAMLFDEADLRILATPEEATQAVLKGEAHAYVGDTAEAAFLALRHPEQIDRPLGKPLLISVAGMGVKRGEQELLNFLNAWITASAADKWLSATHKHWFETIKWRDLVNEQ